LHILSSGYLEENTKDFEAEYGYRMEFNEDSTWKDRSIDFAEFLKRKTRWWRGCTLWVCATTKARLPDNFSFDVQRMFFAHGRWLDWEIDDKLGSKSPTAIKLG